MKIELICLANSRKEGGRCVAGIRTDGGGWIRPVSLSPSGTLFERHYVLDNGSEAGLFDVIEIEVEGSRPEPHQPENWVLADTRWRLVDRLSPALALPTLAQYLVSGPDLFSNRSDRVGYEYLRGSPTRSSLALVEAPAVLWSISNGFRGNRQTRAIFELRGQQYNLAVTDLAWAERLSHLDLGTHLQEAAGITPRDRLFLTISLGEPFNGECFKLIAAVMLFPG